MTTNNKCFGCLKVTDSNESPFIVASSTNTKIALRPQKNGWFGRCSVVFKDHKNNVSNMKRMRIQGDNEFDLLDTELRKVTTIMTKVYCLQYGCKHLNYLEAGNLGDSHRHCHIIPRYDVPIEVGEKKYPDPQYDPKTKKFSALNLADPKLKARMGEDELATVKVHIQYELMKLVHTDEFTRNLMCKHDVKLVDPDQKTLTLLKEINKQFKIKLSVIVNIKD